MARYHPAWYPYRLTRRITLADGTRLVNLKDAADLLTGERFVGVTKWAALDRAIELVTAAGELGGRDRIKAATDRLKRDHGFFDNPPGRARPHRIGLDRACAGGLALEADSLGEKQ
jgi:hypothetical protein